MRLLAILIGLTLGSMLIAEEGSETAGEEPAVKPYPLTTCIVSDEELGSMGEPYVFVHEGQEIKMCCKSCKKKFKKDTATYLAKLAPAEGATEQAPAEQAEDGQDTAEEAPETDKEATDEHAGHSH